MKYYLYSDHLKDTYQHSLTSFRFHLMIDIIEDLIDLPINLSLKHHRKKMGSLASRLLLKQWQQVNVKMSDVLLQDEQLPYFIHSNKQTWYVSFSHSERHVAVLVADTPRLGIDIEDSAISAAVAQRFFTAPEIDWLNTLESTQQVTARKLLWVLKESHIKKQTNAKQATSLLDGLSTSMMDGINQAVFFDKNSECDYNPFYNKPDFKEQNYSNLQQFCGFIPCYQCGFIIG